MHRPSIYKVGDTVVLRKIHQFGEELGYKNGETLTIASIDKDGDLWFEEHGRPALCLGPMLVEPVSLTADGDA